MPYTIEDQALTERYFKDELTEMERESFNARLENDVEFKNGVSMYGVLGRVVQQMELSEIQELAKTIKGTGRGRWRWFFGGFSFLLVALFAPLYFFYFVKDNRPEDTVRAYMKAVGDYDINALKSLSTKESQKDIEFLMLLPTSLTQKKDTIIGDVSCPDKIDGNATECSSCCEVPSAKARRYELVLEDGQWKVTFDLIHFAHTPEGACLAILSKMRDRKFSEAKQLMTIEVQELERFELNRIEPYTIEKISCETKGNQSICTWCCDQGQFPEPKLVMTQENGIYMATALLRFPYENKKEETHIPKIVIRKAPPLDIPPAPPKLEVFDGAPYIQSGDAKVANKDWQGAYNDYMTVKTHKKYKKYDCKNCDLAGKSNPFRETGQKLMKNEATKSKGEMLLKMADDLDR